MSMTPPPGWYRDPAYPLVERWWDGTAWTDHRRGPEAPQVPLAPPRPVGGGSGRAKAVALVTAGVVLVTSIVTGAFVLGREGGGGGTAATRTTPPTAPAQTTGSPADPSSGDPSVVVDELNGITLPLFDGWVRAQDVAEDDVMMTTPGTYDCPGDPGLCRHGRVVSRTVTANDERSPKALAEHDIADAASTAYDRDLLDNRPFHGVTSHRQLRASPVAVAGSVGYLVRWQVKTGVGPGGYVESLAFPSGVGSRALVIVRFVFDAGADGPPLTDMDRITEGIRPVSTR
ncbi:DUF2510 domain-containing protein [Streptomyces mirabilis]|uniref:DUF2510 domain-containing protein n=1 Tax=Streptomyces mirabilis TaxID=68239 RepID=UPI0021BFFBAF|nr:DUF2510 domain-containing protein [Streptomyces mirabilis]MCT9107348.1 DUF2510 domain-containing protein [Streptomyces mirabilis]